MIAGHDVPNVERAKLNIPILEGGSREHIFIDRAIQLERGYEQDTTAPFVHLEL